MSNMEDIYKDAYEEMLQQSIAFRPIFVKITGNAASAILLSQMFFWEKSKAMSINRKILIDKQDGKEYGYWYHTTDQLQSELFLSEKQIREARRVLRSLGILKEGFAGLPPKIFYRVDTKRLAYLIYCAKNNLAIEPIAEIPTEWKKSLAVTKGNLQRLQKDTFKGDRSGKDVGNQSGNTSDTDLNTDKTDTDKTYSEKPETDFSDQTDSPNFDNKEKVANLGVEKPAKTKAPRKGSFESETPSNIVCRFILDFCKFKNTPEHRNALNITECKALRAEAERLLKEPGFDAARLEEFRTWFNNSFAGQKRNGYACGYGKIRDLWSGFLQSCGTRTQTVQAAQNGTEKRVSTDGKWFEYVNTATGNIVRRIAVGGNH